MHSSLGSPSMSDASFVSNSRKPCFSCTMHANMRLLGLADPELKDEELEGSTTRGQEHAGTRSNASKGVLCVFVSLHRQACLRVTYVANAHTSAPWQSCPAAHGPWPDGCKRHDRRWIDTSHSVASAFAVALYACVVSLRTLSHNRYTDSLVSSRLLSPFLRVASRYFQLRVVAALSFASCYFLCDCD